MQFLKANKTVKIPILKIISTLLAEIFYHRIVSVYTVRNKKLSLALQRKYASHTQIVIQSSSYLSRIQFWTLLLVNRLQIRLHALRINSFINRNRPIHFGLQSSLRILLMLVKERIPRTARDFYLLMFSLRKFAKVLI